MKEHQNLENTAETTVIRKGTILELVILIALSVAFIALGVLLLLENSLSAILPMAILVFSGAAVALLFTAQFLWFRVTVENNTLTVRQLGKQTETHAYLDVSWKLRFPDKKNSALVLCVKGKPVASVHASTPGIATLASFRHLGKIAKGEKEFLKDLGL